MNKKEYEEKEMAKLGKAFFKIFANQTDGRANIYTADK